MRRARSALLAAAAASVAISASMASAHTDALGYLVSDGSADGLFNVQIVYGSWHDGIVAAEGAVQLNRADSSVVGTQVFSILLSNVPDGSLPAGLTAGQNFFYVSADGNSLVATDSANNGVYNFQAATFSDITAGTYTFAYASTSGLSQVWTPAGNAISSGTFTVTSSGGVTVPGQANDIDTANPNYGSSNLGSSVNPTFAGGTLLIDEAGETYSNDFVLDDTPTNTIDMNGNTTVLSGTFSDTEAGAAGVITYADSGEGGQVTLTGASTYTGTTTLNSGTLVLSGDATLGADSASTLVNGGTLDLGGTGQVQASVMQAGGTIANGDFAVGTYTLTGGTLAGNAVIDAEGSIDVQAGTVDGALTGAAGLAKTGGGTVTLAGANGYTGGTVVDAGTLALSGSGTLGSSAGTTTVNGGTLDLGGTSQAQASLNQTGGFVQNGTFSVDTYSLTGGTLAADAIIDADDTFDVQVGRVNGILTGTAGLIKTGTGGVELSGANSYTGNTVIEDGTLALSGAGTLGSAEGTTTINRGTLDLGGTSQTQASLTQGIATVQNGTLTLGSYTMFSGTLSSTVIADVSETIDVRAGMVDGVLTGTAGLSKSGSAQVTLTAANSYTGGTVVNEGVLALTGNGSIVSSLVVDAPGTFDFSAANGDRTLTTAMGAGVIELGSNTLTLTQASGAFAGSINGTGGLILTASQGYALNGPSTYSGGTALLAGTLSLGDDNALGTGTLAMSEFTTIDLTGNGMTIGNAITVSGDPTINVATGVTATVAGTISDGTEPGDIVKTGGGTLIFTGNNTYSAGTTVSGGTLQLGDGGTSGAILGDVLNNATLAFDRSDAVVFSGTISGSGVVTQAGTGTTTLSGVNTYSGGTTISGGRLAGSATSFGSGAILDNAALVLNQATDAIFANAIDGTGTLTKLGAGVLTLTGTSGLSGVTGVAQGELSVIGSLASSRVVLASGTRLSGTGTVGGITAAAGSTIAPGGAAVGTLTVNGDVAQQADATYAVQVTAGSTLSDRIAASGAATIDSGAILAVTKTNTGTRYGLGTRYTVLTAADGVTGTYTLTGDTAVSAFYDLVIDYDASKVYLDVAQTSSFVSAAITPNERSVAGALDALDATVGLRDALGYLQSFEEARIAFGQLSGEIHSSAKSALVQDSQYLRDAVSSRLRSGGDGEAAGKPGLSIWGNGYGSWGSLAGNGNAGVLHRSARGLLAGADVPLGATARIGVLAGYSRSKFHTAQHRDSGDSDNYHVGIYAGHDVGPLILQVGAAYTWHKLGFDRSVGFTGFSDALTSKYDGHTAQAFGEVGYRIAVNSGYFEPFAQVSYVRLHTDAFAENGGDAALVGRSRNTEVTFSTLGLRGNLDVAKQGALRLFWSTGWRHAFGNRTPFTDLRFGAGTQVFGIAGAPIAVNAAALQAGIEATMGSGVSLSASYSGQTGRNVQDHGVKGNLTWRF
ncbi:autotransporter domain-containing protein [Novosphingobium resinovorum]|uniref:autotransporter domain-containing protein n=1 Tax=Novosphingobium resinovorum TaxID=158500 RepID=UPI002ED61F86|nr:autotransporter domain-containing protein [Novosphingobium resinovorum]